MKGDGYIFFCCEIRNVVKLYYLRERKERDNEIAEQQAVVGRSVHLS